MREIALDTVSLQHALRRPKKQRTQTKVYSSTLDIRICEGKIKIVLDQLGALLEEYRQTCGEEIVSVQINRWESYNGIKMIQTIPKIPNRTRRKFLQLGFVDTMDKVVVALAMVSKSKIAVSDDGDFWDPKNKSSKGNPRACIAELCLQDLGITVMLLKKILAP